MSWAMKRLQGIAILMLACQGLRATEPTCREVAAIAEMARSRSTASLANWKPKAGDGYFANLVFAARSFEIHSNDAKLAAGVFDLLPKTPEQETVWYQFGSQLCHDESDRDLKTLAQFGGRLPRIFARAVLVVPARMLEYVSYDETAVQDPDSDYAVQMQTVCRKRNREFLSGGSAGTKDAGGVRVDHFPAGGMPRDQIA